ncbi:zinc finger and BTB domain-containing protein 49 [Denticeps clupeoides]|uniref:C2H2-type domain-containing protein n=1 Tax=Denticeps clupeoides TaxID=299321 RepID=A0AAY4DES2_9TELE|nr:zinc finger and BTB domain-containing protein 49-like [Denticeps clupeoides]
MTATERDSSAVVAELSLSFRDELTATIHSALGVAVEVAVLEVTKLVGQVLRDVRDQMHEALRDNESLKLRLRAATQQTSPKRLSRRAEGAKVPGARGGDDDACSERATRGGRYPSGDAESFREISVDGRIRTQDVKGDAPEAVGSTVTKKERPVSRSCDRGDGEHASRARATQAPLDGQVTVSEIEVKTEGPSLQCSPAAAPFGPGEEDPADFEADSLSLAQSRLLEDWRPEPLQLQNCDSDAFVASASRSLDDSPIFSAEIPDLDLLSPSAPGQPAVFPKPVQSDDALAAEVYMPLPGGPSNAASQHVCQACGEAFLLPEDLHRHHSLAHPKNLNRSPKTRLFPPGRSPYHCSLCGRDFNRMEHLKIHQRIHTGERPYACLVCNARFRHSWALTRHFRIHTGEKPYACSLCGKTFRNCGGLRFHQRSHAAGTMGGVS